MGTVKYFLVLLFAGTVFAQTGLPVHTNRLAFYGEVRAVRDSIVTLQTKYYNVNKRYFQGLPSSVNIGNLSDALKQFDRTTKPFDQSETLANFGLRDISVRGTYKIDVYNGPGGWGYVITVSVIVETDVYSLSRNFGPETWRDTNLAFLKLSKIPKME